jgi:hypothetical protein
MSPTSLRRFRVTVLTWSAYRTEVEADNAEHAEELAEELWQTDAPHAMPNDLRRKLVTSVGNWLHAPTL